MNKHRREHLTAKYGIDKPPMNPAMNTTVSAVLDAERIEDQGRRGRDLTSLFDPIWSPAMHEIADKTMWKLRTALADGEVQLESHGYDMAHEIDLDNPPTDAVFIYRVGDRYLLVCCRAGACHDERRLRGTGYFGDMLNHFAALDDYYVYNSGADRELKCTVNLSTDCLANDEDWGAGRTRQITTRRGQFVLTWRCCITCERLAGQMAETNFRISVMEAQAKLPPGAVIDPLSPVAPRP